MWLEAQREFIVALKEYKRVYENILEQEKRLDQAKKQLVSAVRMASSPGHSHDFNFVGVAWGQGYCLCVWGEWGEGWFREERRVCMCELSE